MESNIHSAGKHERKRWFKGNAMSSVCVTAGRYDKKNDADRGGYCYYAEVNNTFHDLLNLISLQIIGKLNPIAVLSIIQNNSHF